MPCKDPSGMVIASVAGQNVMAVVCYDTGSLVTLNVDAGGNLSALGSVSGLAAPFPGIALDGTNVLVPLFGVSGMSNGGVAKVSVANPAAPVITGMATLASPVPGGTANPGSLAVGNGYVFVAAGSESGPQSSSSTIQVVNETTMTVVGTPLAVAHSPQQIAVVGNVAYATFYDAAQLESINVANPANLTALQVYPLTTGTVPCHAIGLSVTNEVAFVGCYGESVVEKFNVSDPTFMKLVQTLTNVDSPQGFHYASPYLLVTDGVTGGKVYQINPGTGLSGSV